MARRIKIRPNQNLNTIVAYMQIHGRDVYSYVSTDRIPELKTIEAPAKDFARELFFILHPVELRHDSPILTPDRFEGGAWYLDRETQNICYADTAQGVNEVVFSSTGATARS